MNKQILPSKIAGTVKAPSSKSYSHRALLIAALAKGTSTLENVLDCDDTRVTINALRKFGVRVVENKNKITITGVDGYFDIAKKHISINAANSGTSFRMLCAVSCLTNGTVDLSGNARLLERPIVGLVKALSEMGIQISFIGKQHQYPPLRIQGSVLNSGSVTISAHESSQFVSAVLLVAPYAQKDTEIKISSLSSASYIEITRDLMNKFQVQSFRNRNTITIPSKQHGIGVDYLVEGDYSSASYLLAAAAITGSALTVTNLNDNSVQGDKKIIEILKKMGCIIGFKNSTVTIIGKPLQSISIDMNTCPDLVPTVAVVAAFAKGVTIIQNISHLKYKESDRIQAMVSQLKKMKIKATYDSDNLVIQGGKPESTTIDTYGDHRIAMSFAISGLMIKNGTIIKDADVVSKSYPNFWDDLTKIGMRINS
jgi:3-phosphoshikimate 1-carboxyvinyltransferase